MRFKTSILGCVLFGVAGCGGGGGGDSTPSQPSTPAKPAIAAGDDSASFAEATSDYDAILDVLANDTVDGRAVNKSLYAVSSDDLAGLPDITLSDTGIIDLAPDIAPGTYAFLYDICQIADPANCDEGAVEITVTPLPANVLFAENFDHQPAGIYIEAQREEDFGPSTINYGIDEGRVHVSKAGPDDTSALRLTYPDGVVGATVSGGTWHYPLDADYNEVTLTFDFKFEPGFDWSPVAGETNARRGGKLLGLTGGGLAATGGHPATGTNGWSSRLQWKDNGSLCQYVYHMDQLANFGDCFYFPASPVPQTRAENQAMRSTDYLFINQDQFYTYSQTVIMNDIGQHNGEIIVHLDGNLALHITDIMFRSDPALAIEDFYFTTYLGGGSDHIMNTRGHILFDNVRVELPE